MFASEIIDAAEDRHVRIDLIFARNIYEAVIFDVKIRTAEIQLFARVDKLRFDCRAQFFAP